MIPGPRRIVIEEQGRSLPPPAPRQKWDLQDALLILGVLLLEAAAAAIWWPAALILGGLLSLGFAWLIEKSKRLGVHSGTSE